MADIIRNIITRIDSTVNWTTLNPVPANGEQCIEILQKGLFKLKVGDGKTPWIALKYATMNGHDPRIGDLSELITRDKTNIVYAINSVQEEVNLTEDDIARIKEILKHVVPQYDTLPMAAEGLLGIVAQYIGETTEQYTHNYFYEVTSHTEEDPETGEEITVYEWTRTSVQPETDLEPVWEAIEELDNRKIDHFEVLPSAEENLGLIAQYVGENTGDYKTGLFYEAIHHEEASDYNVTSSNEELVITVDKEYFEEHQEHDHDLHFEFAWDGQHWKDENEHVLNLHAMGITIEGEPEVDDTLVIDYKTEISEYVWDKVDTTDISEKVDKTHENMKIYGTDEHGNQHLYDKEDFGKVDDVRLNGVSVVENKIANLEPGAEDIAYTNEQYPTMQTLQDAMDKLLYITPSVSLSGGGTYEVGSTRSTTSLTWTWNKAIKTQSLNQGIGSLEPNVRSYTYNTPITSNTTFTITGSDGTTTKSSSTTVSFRKYYYYGTSSKATLSDADIRGLRTSTSGGREWCSSNQTLSEKEFNCTPTSASPDGFYAYFVLPSEYAKSEYTVKVNGLPNTGYLKSTKSDYTNEYGVVIPMTIFRFMKDNKLSTKYKIEVA